MNLIFLVFIHVAAAFGNQTIQSKEYCFLSQHAWHDSFSTAHVLLKHKSKLDPKKLAYKMVLDPDLKMCFSFAAYPEDIPQIEKYVTGFKIKYKENEINISERLRKRIVPLKISPNHKIRALKQLWELTPHINLAFNPLENNKQIKLRFAKHVHVGEGPEGNVYYNETFKKNRFLSNDILNIRAFYLHERLISFEFELNGKTLNIMRGTGYPIGLQQIIRWFLNDQTAAIYSFYPAESFNPKTGEMIYGAEIETLPD